MVLTNRIEWENIRSIDTATIGSGAYFAIGTPLGQASFILKMVNLSNINVLVSNDGVNDKDVCPASGFWLYDEDAGGRNNQFLAKNTQIYIKNAAGAAAGVGIVYLVTQYIISG